MHRELETARRALRVLAIDIGGTSVKILVSGAEQRRKFASGPEMTPQNMVREVKRSRRGLGIRGRFDRLSGSVTQ